MSHTENPLQAVAGTAFLLLAAAVHGAQATAVGSRVETAPVPSSGDAADDAAVWIHPTHAGLSLVLGTDKESGLGVYDLAGNLRQFLPDGSLNNVDLRYGFSLSGGQVALVTSGERDQDRLAIYAVDANERTLQDVAARRIPLGMEVYGCCMYRSPITGDFYFFATSEEGAVQQWRLFPADAGGVDAELVRSFEVGGQSEGCVADDENGSFFVGEEEVGIWRYGAEPSAGDARILVDSTGAGNLEEDVEGLAIYYAAGDRGYLLASSQGSSSFEIYERAAPHAHLGSFQIGANPALGIDAVSGTDGLDVTNLRLGSAFPDGVFIAQDDSNPGANQNFKLVSWQDIAGSATPPLVVDNAYDPFGARCPVAGSVFRNGSGVNPVRLIELEVPALGSTWAIELDCTGHAPSTAIVVAFGRPSQGSFFGAGEMLVDRLSHLCFTLSAPHSGSVVALGAPIPLDLGLCGLRASLQGACMGAPGIVLSNALDLTIGR